MKRTLNPLAKSGGFSLVELMVALVVGLLVTIGAFQLFVISQRTFSHSLAVLERQETLRFIVDSISYDVRSAAVTDLVGDDGEALSDSSTLSLTFNKENSICNSDEYTLRYYQPAIDSGEESEDSDGSVQNAIYVESVCDGAIIDEPIVLGVAEINFNYISFGLGVRATITMRDELSRIEDQTYRFVIANRSAVGRALELWGE